jgi:hypothetical protein
LYKLAKYSHSSLSAAWTMSPSLMEANLVVKARIVAMWNLFWWDFVKHRQLSLLVESCQDVEIGDDRRGRTRSCLTGG